MLERTDLGNTTFENCRWTQEFTKETGPFREGYRDFHGKEVVIRRQTDGLICSGFFQCYSPSKFVIHELGIWDTKKKEWDLPDVPNTRVAFFLYSKIDKIGVL